MKAGRSHHLKRVVVVLVVRELGAGVVQCPPSAALYLVGEGRGVVGKYDQRHATQFPEGALESLPQGQESLVGNHLGVAPPRMAQHQMEQQVAVAPAADADSQGVAVGEVDLGLAARWMLLGEVDLLIRPVERSPVL